MLTSCFKRSEAQLSALSHVLSMICCTTITNSPICQGLTMKDAFPSQHKPHKHIGWLLAVCCLSLSLRALPDRTHCFKHHSSHNEQKDGVHWFRILLHRVTHLAFGHISLFKTNSPAHALVLLVGCVSLHHRGIPPSRHHSGIHKINCATILKVIVMDII